MWKGLQLGIATEQLLSEILHGSQALHSETSHCEVDFIIIIIIIIISTPVEGIL